MREKIQKSDTKLVSMIIKYVFSLLIVLLTMKTTRSVAHTLFGVVELILILFISDLLVHVHRYLGWLGSLMLLLFNAENIVLLFSGSYVTYVMLENVDSIQDLAGKAIIYGIGAVAGIVFSFLPIRPTNFPRKVVGLIAGAAAVIEIAMLGACGIAYSPIGAVYGLYDQWKTQKSMYASEGEFDENILDSFYKGAEVTESEEAVETFAMMTDKAEAEETMELLAEETETEETFFEEASAEITEEGELHLNEYITSGAGSKYSCNLNRPNMILIFTEGLSQNVIDDDRGIMPNARALQQQSLSFSNYYNHTFATYRGLSGQLYSGYQHEDYDLNYLISMQDILRDQGYYTSFVNTEPNNSAFTSYLQGFGFDEVISDVFRCDGFVDSMSDASAYDFLFETAQRYDAEKDQPFFLAIYTFGTHTTFDSVDENLVFGDGSNRVLNRFYYADVKLGKFLENFRNSSLASDTVLVFTADHCTFSDEDFRDAFPEYGRACSDLDRIPFFIYYAGGPVGTVNAYGRNSLDLAPTLLDFLNISAPNYFLGESLFVEKADELCLDTIFYDPTFLKSTDGGGVHELDDVTADYVYARIREYFAAKSQKID